MKSGVSGEMSLFREWGKVCRRYVRAGEGNDAAKFVAYWIVVRFLETIGLTAGV